MRGRGDPRVLRPTGNYDSAIERILLGYHTPNDLRILHARERYLWLTKMFGSKMDYLVIDMGCGYGANLDAARQTCWQTERTWGFVGIDIDLGVIHHNRKQYKKIHFVHTNGGEFCPSDIPRRASSGRDRIVTAFEVLGHQEVCSDVGLLHNMKWLAGVGGHCVASIGRFDKDRSYKPHWYFKRCYTAKQFIELWETVGFYETSFYAQTHPANRKYILDRDTIKEVQPAELEKADFMIGVGVV